MSTRRTHDPKGLPQRLGSEALLRQARATKPRRRSSGDGKLGFLARITRPDAPKAPRAPKAPKPPKAPKAPKARTTKAPKGPGLLARWWAGRKEARAKVRAKAPRPRTQASLSGTGTAAVRARAKKKAPGWLARLLTPRPRPARSEADELAGVRRRATMVLAVFAAAVCVVLGRAVQLQLLEGEQYQDAAERQATVSAQIKAKRGVIEDRHGAELAITVDVDSVVANPRQISDPVEAAARLAPILGVSPKRLEQRLSGKRAFAFLRRRVPAEVAAQVRALELRGVSTQKEPKRFYANVDLAAHVLGFTNSAGEGRAGVERRFDDALQGSSTEVLGLRDALGNRVFSEGLVPDAVLEGADLTLTLDRQIQYAAQSALAETVTQYKAKGGVAIVLEPKSGDILALASYPTFNPNNLSGTTSDDHLNRAVSAVFEPGSTMKMVTVSAALEEGLIRPESKIDCEDGQWRFGGRTIRDANHRYGELSVTEVLQKSSNICSAKIGVMLQRDRLYQWLRRFGFGEPTGVELPGELRGIIRDPDTWRDIALANIAFGQGVAVTPLQVVQAAASIANGGVRMRPRLVLKVEDKRGQITEPERPEGVRIMSEKTAREVAKMMTEVTKAGGTALTAAVPGFEVAGKTGTAQKIDPVTRAYSHELYVSSFVGFLPADRPEVAILVLVDEPKGSSYGGVVAAPAFKKIALAALSARSVFPDQPEAREAFLAAYRPEPLPKEGPEAALGPEGDRDKWSDSGDLDGGKDFGAAFAASLSEEAQALLGLESLAEAAPAEVGAGAGRMPNFAGLKLHEVLNRSAEVRCDPVVKGTGRVVHQAPPAGAAIAPGQACTVTLDPRG